MEITLDAKNSNGFLFCLLFTISACGLVKDNDRSKNYVDLLDSSFESELVNPEILLDTSVLVYPQRILSCNNFLIVSDAGGLNKINVVDLMTKTIIGSVAKAGQSSGEVLGLWDFARSSIDSTTFFVYDLTLHKIIKFDLDSIIGNARYKYSEEFLFQSPELNNLCAFESIDDSLFAGTIFNEKGRIVYFTKNGRATKYIGSLPENIKESSPYVYGHSYRADITTTSNSLITSGFFSDIIEIYSRTTERLTTGYHGPDNFWPVYDYKNNSSLVMVDETKVGYLDSDSDDHTAFFIYHGDSKRNVIYTIDKDGNPWKKFVFIGHEIQSLTVDRQLRKVYCLANLDESPKVISFPY